MTNQQIFAAKFEEFLGKHMAKLGMKCTRSPKLRDGKTPDFLVEDGGRTCYVEATHLKLNPAFEERRGEADLKKFLTEQLSPHQTMVLQYEDDDPKERLTNQLSRTDAGIMEIASWANRAELEEEGRYPAETFPVKGIRIQARVLEGRAEGTSGVCWSRGYFSDGTHCKDIRNSLRKKYNKYKPCPDSLGDIPLVIAFCAGVMWRPEMEEAIYGQIDRKVVLRWGSAPTIEPRFKRLVDGIWMNCRNGKLETRHHHLAGVWFFQSPGHALEKPRIFLNPFREDLKSIIPTPMLSNVAQ